MMGHRNMDRIMLAQPCLDLPAQTRYCLLLMGRLAHDEAPLYWGGVSWLQLNMGYSQGPSGRREVMRHLKRLERDGYITRTPKRRGHRVVYELHLPGGYPPVDDG